MNFRHVRMLLLLFTMILWNVLLNAWILERTRQINCFSYETALYSFREHRVSEMCIRDRISSCGVAQIIHHRAVHIVLCRRHTAGGLVKQIILKSGIEQALPDVYKRQ